MAANEMQGALFKLRDDPRITPLGKWLRARHLDELPQFWNVLRGEMSLVRTRPPTLDEVERYRPHHRRRLSMKPGITGLWQLAGNQEIRDFEEIVRLDYQYIDSWSMWLDTRILARTVVKVLQVDVTPPSQQAAPMSREARHRALQRVFWSRLGLPFVRAYAAFSRRWEYVVMNRSLSPECNGEYWLLSLLPPAPLVLDVGLNVGEFTREALRQRPHARVVGFEPARSMQRECATSLGRESRLELLPMAVSNERAVMEFHDSADGSSTLLGGRQTVGETYWVETVTLDDFADERGYTKIHLVKIDVEGYDLHVLEGARRLLARQAIEIFSFEYNEPWINSPQGGLRLPGRHAVCPLPPVQRIPGAVSLHASSRAARSRTDLCGRQPAPARLRRYSGARVPAVAEGSPVLAGGRGRAARAGPRAFRMAARRAPRRRSRYRPDGGQRGLRGSPEPPTSPRVPATPRAGGD